MKSANKTSDPENEYITAKRSESFSGIQSDDQNAILSIALCPHVGYMYIASSFFTLVQQENLIAVDTKYLHLSDRQGRAFGSHLFGKIPSIDYMHNIHLRATPAPQE